MTLNEIHTSQATQDSDLQVQGSSFFQIPRYDDQYDAQTVDEWQEVYATCLLLGKVTKKARIPQEKT
jgi:hypothetical protein